MRVCDFRDWPVPAPGLRAVLGLARQPTWTLLCEVVGSAAAPRTSNTGNGESLKGYRTLRRCRTGLVVPPDSNQGSFSIPLQKLFERPLSWKGASGFLLIA